MQQALTQIFIDRFKKTPQVFFSPGRINLIGEHVDYNDGYVMPAAIDKGVWFAVAANGTSEINCYSRDFDESFSMDLGAIQPSKGWKNYILGVVHVLQKEGFEISGFDCIFGGNLPVGAGLSSSAAVECGMIFSLNQIFELAQSRKSLALMAQQAEHLYPGVKCGIMDQYASLLGMDAHVLLLDCKTVEHEYLPFQLDDHSLFLINSKVQHSLAGGEYNVRRSQCAEGLRILGQKYPGATSFRTVTREMLESCKDALDPEIYRRCGYVVSEIERTLAASEHLKKAEIGAFGALMYATHRGLSKDYEVSCEELDFLVEEARKRGVTGSRMMGGGFGGCTINIIEQDHADAVISEIVQEYEKKFGIAPEVIPVKISNGTHPIELQQAEVAGSR